MDYKAFYGTQAWKNTREAYKRYKGGLCERCFAKGLIVPGHVVHHKIYMDDAKINDPSLSLNFDNLELLCWACHEAEHDKLHIRRKQKRYTVDEFGRVMIAPRSE